MATTSPFGERLRAWRKRRGLSQLDLALTAGTTPRYLSFVETGRSRPGRGVVLRLAEAMGLSLRDRNALLTAAGLRPAYPEGRLDDEALGPIRRVVEQVLANHDPYPGWSFGPGLQVLGSNRAAERLMPGMTALSPEQLVDLWCTPDPSLSRSEQARQVHQVVATIRAEIFHHPHPDLPALLDRAEAHAKRFGPAPDLPESLVLCPTLRIGDREIRTLSTVLRFDKATDVTVAELRIELVFPADEHAERVFRELARAC